MAGAGPAGSLAARGLAARGHRVLLLDRTPFPREKVCGDALSPDALRCLKRAGLFDAVRAASLDLRTATVFSPSRIPLDLPGRYLTLERRVLDALLARGASDAGARFACGEVAAVRPRPGSGAAVRVAGIPGDLEARVVLLATGARTRLAAGLGMVSRRRPSAVAVRCYARSDAALSGLVGAYDRSIAPGYGWVFPLPDGIFNLGVVLFAHAGKAPARALSAVFRSFVGAFPCARDVLARGALVSPLRGGVLRCGLTGVAPLGPGPVLALGETVGTTLPVTGEGIGKALETAEMAVESVDLFLRGDAGALETYPRVLEDRLRARYASLERAASWLSVPWVNDLMARRTRSSPFLRNTIVDLLADRADIACAFSLSGLLRSLLD